MYAGEQLTVRVRAADPLTQKVITDASVSAYFYAPPKNPRVSVPDRSSPDVTVPLAFDPVSRYYLANVSTTGWAAGAWWVQGKVTGGAGGYLAWDYYSFPLDA